MTRRFQCIVFALLFLVAGTASAGALSTAEANALRADMSALMARFQAGDVDALISRTHSSLVALAGGQQAYEAMTREAMGQVEAQGVSFVSLELGEPTPTYPAGDEEVCFVPQVSVLQVQGRRVRSTSFMIAIRSAAGGPWSYLDGSGLKDRPEMLYQLLPALQRGVALPPSHAELMQ